MKEKPHTIPVVLTIDTEPDDAWTGNLAIRLGRRMGLCGVRGILVEFKVEYVLVLARRQQLKW